MKSKVPLAILGLRISVIIYYIIMGGCLVWALLPSPERSDASLAWFLFIFLIPFVVFLEILICFLRKRRFWTWVAGLIVGGLYAPSLFLPFGVMILVGLLSEGSRKEFGLQKTQAEPDVAPHGGPATRLGNSEVTEGPPSVS